MGYAPGTAPRLLVKSVARKWQVFVEGPAQPAGAFKEAHKSGDDEHRLPLPALGRGHGQPLLTARMHLSMP